MIPVSQIEQEITSKIWTLHHHIIRRNSRKEKLLQAPQLASLWSDKQ